MYIIICETDLQFRFDEWDRVLRAGALGWRRGIRWRGRWEGISGWGKHVHPYFKKKKEEKEEIIFLKRALVFPILLFSSISLHWSLRKAFLSQLHILWIFAFRWTYLSFSPLHFTSLFFSQLFERPPQTQYQNNANMKSAIEKNMYSPEREPPLCHPSKMT